MEERPQRTSVPLRPVLLESLCPQLAAWPVWWDSVPRDRPQSATVRRQERVPCMHFWSCPVRRGVPRGSLRAHLQSPWQTGSFSLLKETCPAGESGGEWEVRPPHLLAELGPQGRQLGVGAAI